MPSTKKPASSKRASFPREASYEKRFVKGWERLSRSGRYNMNQLKEAMMLLIANDAPLGPEWLDHALKGDWSDHRECHLEIGRASCRERSVSVSVDLGGGR